MSDLVLGLPSKGRLMEQAERHFADAGYILQKLDGDRGYAAVLQGADGVKLKLLSASAIAGALMRGEIHVGVTGEDLLRELSPSLDGLALVRGLGFGRADLVVAAPAFWLDVRTLDDLEALGAETYAATGRRLRVATKYLRLTAAFFARKGVRHYRLIESAGATEAAPATDDADLIVDITTTGATLAANGLAPLGDGLILRSEAQLAASLSADWSAAARSALKGLLLTLEARRRARDVRIIACPEADPALLGDLAAGHGASLRADGVIVCPTGQASPLARAVSQAAGAPVSVSSTDFLFEPTSRDFERFLARLGG